MTGPEATFVGENAGNYMMKLFDENLIQNIMDLKVGEFYESDPFIMCNNLKWTLQIYSNGNRESNKGFVKIFLKLVSIPKCVNKIHLTYSILCINTLSSWTSMTSYNKDGAKSGWRSRILSLSHWKYNTYSISHNISLLVSVKINYLKLKNNLDLFPFLTFLIPSLIANDDAEKEKELTEKKILLINGYIGKRKILINKMIIDIIVKYLKNWNFMDNDKDNDISPYKYKYKLRYDINKIMINIFASSSNEKRYESSIFDNKWRVAVTPNGTNENHKGFCGVYVSLYNILPQIGPITTKGKVICTALNKCQYFNHIFNTGDTWSNTLCIHRFMKSSDINSNIVNSISFMVEIEILNVIRKQQIDKNIVTESPQIAQILQLTSTQSASLKTSDISPMDSKNDAVNDGNDTMMNARLDLLSVNIEENNKMMKQIQENMLKMSQQLNDLRLIINEEEKNNEFDNIKKEIKAIKNDMNELKNNKINKKLEEMKNWMNDIVELPEYIDLFIENGLESLDVIKHITMNELTNIGITKLGHKIKITQEIVKLNQKSNNIEGGTVYV